MKARKTIPSLLAFGALTFALWTPSEEDASTNAALSSNVDDNSHLEATNQSPIKLDPSIAELQSKLSDLEASIALAEDLIADSEALLDESENEEAEETTMIAGWELEDDNLWLEDPEVPLGDQIKSFEKISAAKPDALPSEGDRVELSLLDGKTATVEVKRGVFSQNGDYSWSGHLEGYGTDYPVVVTYGDNASFAMITTPEGSYSMESVNGKGWLYKNPSEEELTTPGNQDYLEIPGTHSANHDH